MTLPATWLVLEPVPMIQSPTEARRRMSGLHVASVQYPQNGFGAKPVSHRTTYEKTRSRPSVATARMVDHEPSGRQTKTAFRINPELPATVTLLAPSHGDFSP